MTRIETAAHLISNPTLEGYFQTIRLHQDLEAGIWREDGQTFSYTFEVLAQLSIAVAAQIDAQVVGKPGDWVGIALETCREWPSIFWGLIMAGRKALLVDANLDDAALSALVNDAGATAVISRKKRHLPCPTVDIEPLLVPTDGAGFVPHWADHYALCTSGTTGTSRIYVYNGQTVSAQITGIIEYQSINWITREAVGPLKCLAFLPLNHVLGFLMHIMWTAALGYPQIFLKDRAPQTILETCRETGVQLIIGVPLLINSLSSTLKKRVAKESPVKRTAFAAMQRASLSMQKVNPQKGLALGKKLFHSINQNLFGDSLVMVLVGGSHTPREHLKTINALGYPVANGFGMTETGLTSVELMLDLENRLSSSVGYPMPICEYKVLPTGSDPNRGELIIRSKAMHIAQLQDGNLLPPAVDEEGYYHSGDVVHLGEKGRMWVEGRTKDVIIGESGENVYPDELEDLFSGIDGIDQLTILGTKDGDYDAITLLASVGIRYADDTFADSLTAKITQINRGLTPIRRVKYAYITPDTLPLSSAMKVKRNVLKANIENRKMVLKALMLTSGPAVTAAPVETAVVAPPSPILRDDLEIAEIREKVRRCFADILDIDPRTIPDNAHFIDDLGGDSLQSLGVALKVEELFAILIPTEEYYNCVSVGDLSAVVYQRVHGASPFEKEADHQGQPVAPITRVEDMPEYQAFMKRAAMVDGMKNPYFVAHESTLSDVSLMDGKWVLNFGSYNYAGMSGRKETVEAAKAAIDKYGTSASGSRLLAGEKLLHRELEAAIAEWKHTEAAVVLVGGHSTNVTFVGNFCGKDDLIVYDSLSHNSIQEGCRLSGATTKPFPHNDFVALEGILRQQRHNFVKCLVIIEGVYSMDGDIAPVPEFIRVKDAFGCFLLVDEAHSACVIGEHGGGVDEYFGLKGDEIDIKMGTLSKGLGTCGGYLAGSQALIDYLKYNLPGFVFSVGLSPPLAAATLAAIRCLQNDPTIIQDLHRNIRVFLEEAHKRGLDTCLAGETAVIPILVGPDEDAFALSIALGEQGVFVPPAVFPAVPKNKARLRFCVISDHKPDQIVKALDLLVTTAAAMGIVLPAWNPDKS